MSADTTDPRRLSDGGVAMLCGACGAQRRMTFCWAMTHTQFECRSCKSKTAYDPVRVRDAVRRRGPAAS